MKKNKNLHKKTLRQALIQRRSKLTKAELTKAAQQIKDTGESSQALNAELSNAKNILSYSAFNGEISPHLLTNNLTGEIYLPKIIDYQNKVMQFFSSKEKKINNRYGILEPIGSGESLTLAMFDVILMPLVGFDQQGNRIGMGAGFYDKAIANKLDDDKPALVGLAHDFQQLDSIQAELWDVPLDVILTNLEIIDPTNKYTV